MDAAASRPKPFCIDHLHARDGTPTRPREGDEFAYHDSSGALQYKRQGRSLRIGISGRAPLEFVFVERHDKDRVLAAIRSFVLQPAQGERFDVQVIQEGHLMRAILVRGAATNELG